MTNTENIQKLREITGAGVMDCKRALEDAKGDFEKAQELIRERGLVKADKKSERVTSAGVIASYVHNERMGVLLELHCETDFVCKSDPFRDLAKDVTMQIAAMDPADVAALLAQPFVKDPKTTIEELIKGVIAKVGENIVVTRFSRLEI